MDIIFTLDDEGSITLENIFPAYNLSVSQDIKSSFGVKRILEEDNFFFEKNSCHSLEGEIQPITYDKIDLSEDSKIDIKMKFLLVL